MSGDATIYLDRLQDKPQQTLYARSRADKPERFHYYNARGDSRYQKLQTGWTRLVGLCRDLHKSGLAYQVRYCLDGCAEEKRPHARLTWSRP